MREAPRKRADEGIKEEGSIEAVNFPSLIRFTSLSLSLAKR